MVEDAVHRVAMVVVAVEIAEDKGAACEAADSRGDTMMVA